MGDDIGSGSVFLIFAVVQLCTAEYGRLLRVENDLKRQSVTEPELMSSPINYPALYRYEFLGVFGCELVLPIAFKRYCL